MTPAGRAGWASGWPVTFTGPLLAVAVAVAAAGLTASPYWLTLLTQSAVNAVAVLGLNIMIGYAGQVTFGHNVFFGVGAYATAMGTTAWQLTPLLAAALGVACCLVLAVLVGIPVLRLRGYYLAMATFALGVAFYAFLGSAPWLHGFIGVAGIPAFGAAGWRLSTLADKYWLSWLVLLVAVVIAWRLRGLRFGRALATLARDEAVAQSVGINPLRYKLAAFALSGVFASLAGSLFAHNTSYISPESFSFLASINFFLMLFIGGLRGVWGVVIGATAVTVLPEVFTGLQQIRPTLLSVLLILILIFRPVGLLAPLVELPRLRLPGRRAAQ